VITNTRPPGMVFLWLARLERQMGSWVAVRAVIGPSRRKPGPVWRGRHAAFRRAARADPHRHRRAPRA